MNTTITLQLDPTQREKLKEAWSEFISPKAPPYSEYQLKPENCTITAYLSGKVVFQGKDAEIYASAFKAASVTNPTAAGSSTSIKTHAGSDEVGTGDYFGPVCVCACIVKEEQIDWLKSLQIKDSKQLTDADMLKLAPLLMEKLQYSLLILDNEKYNRIHQTNNLNMIKAKLHNQAYVNLIHKGAILPELAVIDQFTPKASYFRYLENEKTIIRKLHFETKAENKYPAVACASIIARYGFLKTWEALEKHYEMHFSKGASNKVDQDAALFVQKYGWDKLNTVAKLHFKNTENVKKLIK